MATTRQARRLVRLMKLNRPDCVGVRKMWIHIVGLAERNDSDLFRRLMGYPDDLPDLKRLRPPGGNGRPEGVKESSHARRRAGTLPSTY